MYRKKGVAAPKESHEGGKRSGEGAGVGLSWRGGGSRGRGHTGCVSERRDRHHLSGKPEKIGVMGGKIKKDLRGKSPQYATFMKPK